MEDIFKAAWQELLRRRSKHTFPWNIESTRFLLAHMVLEHARDYRDEAEIIDDVVERIESRDIVQ
jgi:DNA-binding ferritin-like protein